MSVDRARELLERATPVRERIAEIDQLLSDPAVAANPNKLRDLGQERSQVEPAVRFAEELDALVHSITESREIIESGDDADLVELAEAEIEEAEGKLDDVIESLTTELAPKDPDADKDCILEIRAGTGGDEAALFAADLFRMYQRHIETLGWKPEVMSSTESAGGGLKEIIFEVKGRGAFGHLKLESGVHRVQRVPATEASGRIHTSAATVAVLPEAKDVDVEVNEAELRVDVYRASGPGGQGVNTTDSAVRITHLPTGLVVTCQDERSQIKNRAKAMRVLRSRLLDQRRQEEMEKMSSERRSQVMNADRSARIRTYNFPQGRVTDHRINLTLHSLPQIMEGDLTELLDALATAEREGRELSRQ